MINPPSNDPDAQKKQPRRFMGRSIALIGSAANAGEWAQAKRQQENAPQPIRPPAGLKAVIFGHTGQGDYGHELDEIFRNRAGIELVAVADANPAGLSKAVARLKPQRSYADYRELLERERPDLVCIALRRADQHYAMARAALMAGANLFVEKPFTTDLVQAGELIAEARKKGLKIAVAHQMRLAPNIIHLHQIIKGGMIGELLEIRAWGKQDLRAGGEDMMVLGIHQFDLIRMFAGEPLWCSARAMQNGLEITQRDGRLTEDNVGPVAGDEIFAHFAFSGGVNVTWQSRRKLRDQLGNWGIDFQGSEGAARINCNVPPSVYTLRRGSWSEDGRSDRWEPLSTDPTRNDYPGRSAFAIANTRLVDDWLDSIRSDREPVCNATNAMKAIEMAMGVYQGALQGTRVSFPLRDRQHPFIR